MSFIVYHFRKSTAFIHLSSCNANAKLVEALLRLLSFSVILLNPPIKSKSGISSLSVAFHTAFSLANV